MLRAVRACLGGIGDVCGVVLVSFVLVEQGRDGYVSDWFLVGATVDAFSYQKFGPVALCISYHWTSSVFW